MVPITRQAAEEDPSAPLWTKVDHRSPRREMVHAKSPASSRSWESSSQIQSAKQSGWRTPLIQWLVKDGMMPCQPISEVSDATMGATSNYQIIQSYDAWKCHQQSSSVNCCCRLSPSDRCQGRLLENWWHMVLPATTWNSSPRFHVDIRYRVDEAWDAQRCQKWYLETSVWA